MYRNIENYIERNWNGFHNFPVVVSKKYQQKQIPSTPLSSKYLERRKEMQISKSITYNTIYMLILLTNTAAKQIIRLAAEASYKLQIQR